jgi:GNAT superfamily N-acetyltransferase
MEYSGVQTIPGKELTPEIIEQCVSVIKSGCAVDSEVAAQRLPDAVMVAILRHGQTIVGVGAIKRLRPSYARRVAQKSGFKFDPGMNELGYVAVLEDHRKKGLSSQIIDALLGQFNGPLWATTYNHLMKQSMSKRGFEHKGDEWDSETSKGKRVSLWIKISK